MYELKIHEKMLGSYVIKYFAGKGYSVFREQPIGRGRADVIAVKMNIKEVERRVQHGINYIPMKTLLRILRILNDRKEATIEDLSLWLGYSTSYIRKVVSSVNPLYLKLNNGKVSKLCDYRPYVDEVVAVEIKVGNWRQGLIQAEEYLWAANMSYLAIYSGNYYRIPERAIKWARNKGIGIIAVGRNGKVVEKIPAEPVGPRSYSSSYILTESLWAKLSKTVIHHFK